MASLGFEDRAIPLSVFVSDPRYGGHGRHLTGWPLFRETASAVMIPTFRTVPNGSPQRGKGHSHSLRRVNPDIFIVHQVTLFREGEVGRDEPGGATELPIALGDSPHGSSVVYS